MASTYAKNQKEKLYLFLSNAEVEMTNSLAERTVKPYVINRKEFLFSDTEKCADASAAIMSTIETAKRNRLDIYCICFICWLFCLNGGCSHRRTDQKCYAVEYGDASLLQSNIQWDTVSAAQQHTVLVARYNKRNITISILIQFRKDSNHYSLTSHGWLTDLLNASGTRLLSDTTVGRW